jgi:hypothetical protein
MRSVHERINRVLKKKRQTLKAARGDRAKESLGDFYVLSDANVIVQHHVDRLALARELGAIQPYETVED